MQDSRPSSHHGMGATVFPGGVAFRVWAPNARQVCVAGTFNDWSETAHPLAREEDGMWSVDVLGAKVGNEYKFVINTPAIWRSDPYAREVTAPYGNSVVCDPAFDWGNGEFRLPPVNELILYEMSLATLDGESYGPPGNLEGAVERLPSLKELGVNAIQVMPYMESPGSYFWGYTPGHPFAIESGYGGPEAFKEFVKEAHANELAVIFDVTYSHLGRYDSNLWQFDGRREKDKGGIYFFNDWRSNTPWGDTRPDYGRAEVRAYLLDNARMWLEEYRVDGLRLGATAFIRNVQGNDDDSDRDIAEGWSLMQRINEKVHARRPAKISIAEDLRNNSRITRQVDDDGAGFDVQWDADFVFPVREAIVTPEDRDRNVHAIQFAIGHRFGEDAFERVIYTESHDSIANGRERIPQEIWPGNADSWFSKKRSTLGAVFVFTSPGIPMVFDGQEFLEDQWRPSLADADPSEKERFGGIRRLYRHLIALRRNRKNTTRGLCGPHVQIHHVSDDDKVIAFHRWDRGGPRDSVVVVVNMANLPRDGYTIGFPRDGLWKVRFNSDRNEYDTEFGDYAGGDVHAEEGETDDLPYHADIGIGPYSALIFSQDE